MKINMKQTLIILCAALFVLGQSCSGTAENLATRTYEQDGKKFIVQKMPADFNDGESERETGIRYYRLIVETPMPVRDSSDVNYVNFGVQESVKLVKQQDSIAPMFIQRISNGKETMYEYIVAFADDAKLAGGYEIHLNDQVFGLGKVSVKF